MRPGGSHPLSFRTARSGRPGGRREPRYSLLATPPGDIGEEVQSDTQRPDDADEVQICQLAAYEMAEEQPELLAAAHERQIRRRREVEQLLGPGRNLELRVG